MNCKKVGRLLSSYMDNEVSLKQKEAIEGHLSGCPHCRAELEALTRVQQELRQGLRSMAAGASPSPGALAATRANLPKEDGRRVPTMADFRSRVAWAVASALRPTWQKALASGLAVLLVTGLCLGIVLSPREPTADISPGSIQLPRFSSYDELNEFLTSNSQSTNFYELYGRQLDISEAQSEAGAWVSAQGLSPGFIVSSDSGIPYSATNIQVKGVDEADIVKTDGEFIYLVSGTKLYIAKAYPAEDASILAKIEFEQRPEGLFINGDKLAVILNGAGVLFETTISDRAGLEPVTVVKGSGTTIRIYDVSRRERPSLDREVSVDGWYCGSRMVGDYVYLVVNQPAYKYDGRAILPEISIGGAVRQIPATDISHVDVPDYSYQYTTIMAVDTQSPDEDPSLETILMGAASQMYMSLNNLYLVISDWQYPETTSIYRIGTQEGDIVAQATGQVPGRVLNQFSMDEYSDTFRIATTSRGTTGSQNSVYVMNMGLETIGKLENLAPGETIYSARFMGERCYLVTFRQVDPFFVIDLADPRNPKVLGELKITGYSSYLHPYDKDHVIGIGMETGSGVKISIFDVSDVENPQELARYVIGDAGTYSAVLTDHKALLFDKSRGLLVIPVSVAERTSGTEYVYFSYWQGAYVFDVSLEHGLTLRGRISHPDPGDQTGGMDYYAPYVYVLPYQLPYQMEAQITRSLYIDDVLYTISDAKIKMNDLDTLQDIKTIAIT